MCPSLLHGLLQLLDRPKLPYFACVHTDIPACHGKTASEKGVPSHQSQISHRCLSRFEMLNCLALGLRLLAGWVQEARVQPPKAPAASPRAQALPAQPTADQEMLAQSPRALRAAATALLQPFLEAGLGPASTAALELQRRLATPSSAGAVAGEAAQEAAGSSQRATFGQLWAAATASLAADSPLRSGVAVDSHLRFVAPRVAGASPEVSIENALIMLSSLALAQSSSFSA